MENKMNKTKLIIIIIVALVVIAAIALAVIFLNRETEIEENTPGTISSSDSEFETLTVNDVELSYDEEKNETKITFAIKNNSEEKIEKTTVQIQLLDESENMIAGVETYIETIDSKGQHPIDLFLAGNIEGIKKIKLANPQKVEDETTVEDTEQTAE